MPVISAMFGPRDSVTQYPLGQVMLAMALEEQTGALNYWSGYHYGKIMESRAKAARRR